jgi:MFS family permease
VFVSSFGFSTSFYLMLSVVPLYATSVGAGGAGAGLATGALMLSTVAAELVTPLLVSRFGYRAVFAAGFVLLGAPAFALGAVPTAPGTSSPAVSRRWPALRPTTASTPSCQITRSSWSAEGPAPGSGRFVPGTVTSVAEPEWGSWRRCGR